MKTLRWTLLILLLVPPTAGGQTFPSADVPRTIPDADFNGVTSTLLVPASITVTDVELGLDELRHTCVADLRIELTSPAGTTAPLILSAPESGILLGAGCPVDFVAAVLDDEATTGLADGTAPYTGRFRVDHPSVGASPLRAFDGEDAAGTWTLRLFDLIAGETGTLRGWSLRLNRPVVEIPALSRGGLAALAASLTLAGLALLRRRVPAPRSPPPAG